MNHIEQQKHRSMAHRPDEGKCRPTPQRAALGEYAVLDGENAGETYAQDLKPDPLSRANLTPRQMDAGRRFEEFMHRVRGGGPGQRSCLDFDPPGHDVSDGNPELEREWKDLRAYLGFVAFQAVDAVCYRQEVPVNERVLRQSLEMAADFWGL